MDENKNKIYKLVGAKVLYYRTLEGLTQEELANKIHINVSTLSCIERGKYNQGVSLAMLFDIAEGLNIEVNLLVTFNDDEKKLLWKSINSMRRDSYEVLYKLWCQNER